MAETRRLAATMGQVTRHPTSIRPPTSTRAIFGTFSRYIPPPGHSIEVLQNRHVSIGCYITMQPSSWLSSLRVISSAPSTTPPRSLARSAALPPSNCTTRTPELSGSSAAARLCLDRDESKKNTVSIVALP